MRMVSCSGTELELMLRSGGLSCPSCRAALRPWGWARLRSVWLGAGRRLSVRPRRARCSRCRGTHVLLPDWVAPRRAYAARVVRRAVTAHAAAGLSRRRISRQLGVPEATVRDWLRAVRTGRDDQVRTKSGDCNTKPP